MKLRDIEATCVSYRPVLQLRSESLEDVDVQVVAQGMHVQDPSRILRGRANWVTCGAYSPDGTKIVAGSWDETLRLWDPSSGKSIAKPTTGHKSWTNVCFSPDAFRITSASSQSMIRLCAGHTGEALGEPLTGHDGGVECIAFSPDGTRLASNGKDSTVRLWDVEKRSCIGEPLRGHSDVVYSLAFSSNGSLVFSGSEGKTIRCWDASSGEPIGHPLMRHTGRINSIAVSQDKTIRAWDVGAFPWEADRSFADCDLRGPDRIPAQIPEDGWIRTTNGGLLLWVPPEHRNAVCDMCLFCISMDESDGSIRIFWDKLCHGENELFVCVVHYSLMFNIYMK